MKKLLMLMSSVLLVACMPNIGSDEKDDLDLTSKFNSTWNIYESFVANDDGTITYHALPWGGLVGSFREHNMPVDWSGYESITFEFAEPTKVPTQIMVSDLLKTTGKAGISSLTCYFDGSDVTSVSEVALQSSDTSVVTVKRVYLNPANGTWESSPIWTGNCAFGNWEAGFVIKPEVFEAANEGDKLEFVYTTDQSIEESRFWLIKTIYNETENTLQGNDNELNEWGCVLLNKDAKTYRIVLTAKDIVNLRKTGLYASGHYAIVSQVNLVKKKLANSPSDV